MGEKASGVHKKEDLRVTRTKAMLRQALLALMAEHGFERVTVDMLAREAFLSRNTFYLHYHDKRELLESVEDEEIARILAEVERVPMAELGEEGLGGRLTAAGLLNAFSHIRANADFYGLMASDKGDPSFMPRLTQAMAQTFASKLGDAGLAGRYIVPAVASAYASLITTWVEGDMEDDPKDVATAFLGAFREVPLNVMGRRSN